MKKSGKILSLLLSLIMVMAVCPSFAMGAETAGEQAEGISLDLMTTQSGYAVTEDIDFSRVMAQMEEADATLELTSSDIRC